MWFRKTLRIQTGGRGTFEITDRVAALVHDSGIGTGLCHVFNQHTSASLALCENADPTVRQDLETFMAALVPDGDPRFVHDQEGDDDMPAHVRTILTATAIDIPVEHARLMLGTWQGIYLWEHRTERHERSLVVTVFGN
ncbi:MAG: YjbQ family protein [Proteobacteria bacterium]|nr:MAG: YjbQ family protein [Pseudomonadota bacterium]